MMTGNPIAAEGTQNEVRRTGSVEHRHYVTLAYRFRDAKRHCEEEPLDRNKEEDLATPYMEQNVIAWRHLGISKEEERLVRDAIAFNRTPAHD